jgi:hypothetical protein
VGLRLPRKDREIAKKKQKQKPPILMRRMKIILVGCDSAVTGQWSLSPLQSVINPPAPSMTGTRARKSYGCTNTINYHSKTFIHTGSRCKLAASF